MKNPAAHRLDFDRLLVKHLAYREFYDYLIYDGIVHEKEDNIGYFFTNIPIENWVSSAFIWPSSKWAHISKEWMIMVRTNSFNRKVNSKIIIL